MKFPSRLSFILTAGILITGVAHAQTSAAPLASDLYVGTAAGQHANVQSAVTAACATNNGHRIVIPAGYKGLDSVLSVKGGCANTWIDDQRTTIPTRYSWNGDFYLLNVFHNQPMNGLSTFPDQIWQNYFIDDATKPNFIAGMPGNRLNYGMPASGQHCNQIGEGYSIGNAAGGHGWSGQHCQQFQQYIFESGLHQMISMIQTKTGKSDLDILYGYIQDAQSAHQTASDEGTFAFTFQNAETGNYKSHVVTGGSGIIHPSDSNLLSGQNRYVLDITQKLGSGHITATTVGYAIQPNLTVATVDEKLQQSSWIGTISSANNSAPLCDNTTLFCLPDNQVRNQHGASRQYPYTVTTIAGARGSTEWVCLAGDQYAETAHIDAGMQTFSNTQNYEAGQYVLFHDTIYKMTTRQQMPLGDATQPGSFTNPPSSYPDPPSDTAHWALSKDDLSGKIFLSSRYPNRQVVLFAGACTYLNVQQEQAFKGWRNAHVVMGVVNFDGLSHLIVGFYRPFLQQDQVLYNSANPHLFTLPGYGARKFTSLSRDATGKVTATLSDASSGIPGLLAGPATVSHATDSSFDGPITDLSFSRLSPNPMASYTATWKQPGTLTTPATSAAAVLSATGASGYDWYPGEELQRACDPKLNNGPGESPFPPFQAELCMGTQGSAGSYMQFYDSAVSFSANDVIEQPMFESGNYGVRSNMYLTCQNCGSSTDVLMTGPMWSGNIWNLIYRGSGNPTTALMTFHGQNAGLYFADQEPSNGAPLLWVSGCANKNCATALDYPLFVDHGAQVGITVSPQTHTLAVNSQGLYVESSLSAQSSTIVSGNVGTLTVSGGSGSVASLGETTNGSDLTNPNFHEDGFLRGFTDKAAGNRHAFEFGDTADTKREVLFYKNTGSGIGIGSGETPAAPGTIALGSGVTVNQATGAAAVHALSASIRTVTSSDTAQPGDYTILCNGTLTETLPATPITGMLLNIINITESGTCTLSGNGHKIGNANPSPSTTVASGINAQLQFDGAIWRILSPIR